MSNPSKTTNNQSIEEILDELEKKFGSSTSSSKSNSSSSHSDNRSKKSTPSLSPNLLIGALVFTLLAVGVASAMFLANKNTELRQQAQVYTVVCGSGSESVCLGQNEGSGCSVGGQNGLCVLDAEPSRCVCDIQDTEPLCTGGICAEPGFDCSNGYYLRGNQQECSETGGFACCPVGNTPTPRPTNTPTATPTPGTGGNTPTPGPVNTPVNTPTNTPTNVPTPTPVVCTGSRIDLSRLDDGSAPADNLLLNTQYQATTGLSFSLQPQLAATQETRDACAATSGPRIALAGAPRTAFQGQETSPGVGGFPDLTYPGDRAQSPFMTDSSDLQSFSCPVRISIASGFRRNDFIFDLVDVDNGERSIINAYNASNQLVTTLTVAAASGNMQFDGRSYPITLIGSSPIAYVDVIPQGTKANWGVAYDNFCVYPTQTSTPSPTPTRTPTPSPSPTATPGPVCVSLTMTPPNPTINQSITLTCGAVAGAFRYEFRVGLPNNTLVTVQPSSAQSRVSQPFTINQSGQHGAQCRICTGSAASTCQPWEISN